jgi:hypothetical protein
MKTELEQAAENYAKQFDYAEDSSPDSDFISGAKWQQEQDNKVPKILESLLEENYDLNIQFHKSMRESIFCFAVAMYDEKLPFKEWEKKYYGNYIEQPKHQQEKMYSEEDMIEFAEFISTYSDKNKNVYGEILHAKSKYDGAERTIDLLRLWFKQFKKK